jgi:hypothetical protein
MTDLLCPICQRPNDPKAERCWYCQADLRHVRKSTSNGGTDWLNSFRDDAMQSPEPLPFDANSQQQEEKPEEVPDWLARIRQLEQSEREVKSGEVVKPQSEPIKKEDELPDWLKEIKAGNSGKKIEPAQAEAAAEIVNSADSSKPQSTEEQITAPEKVEEGNSDDWLTQLASWKPADSPSEEGSANSGDAENSSSDQNQTVLPHFNAMASWDNLTKNANELDPSNGWQRLIPEEPPAEPTLQPDEPKQPEAPVQPEFTSFNEEPVNSQPVASTDDTFDLDSLKENLFSQSTAAEETLPLTDQPGESFQEEDNSALDALDKLFIEDENPPTELEMNPGATPAFVEEPAAFSPFVPDDLPEWLASASLEKNNKKNPEPISEELDSSTLNQNLEKANLPAWLQAIRPGSVEPPIESENNPISSNPQEGLLAGIAGTLQSATLEGSVHRPVGYGSALKVSEHQKNNANLFASLVEETLDDQVEDEPANQKTKKIIWRALLAALIIGIIFFSGNHFQNLIIKPTLFAPEVVAVYDSVNSLPAEKPVLLTGDFEPAVTGELSWSSRILIEHLMRRNLNIVILSNTPAGSTILTQFLETASQNIPGYDLSTHIVNLGYLPGGATGLKLLSENLRAAMPYTHDFQAAWNSDILASVGALSDFGGVIVLSDKAESARVWVEQIQPVLGSTPLMFVVSAQAAPLVQPYFQSRQISGLIAGYGGALAYEQIFQQSSDVPNQMGAFQITLLIVAALILVGGVINLIRPNTTRQKR